MDKQELKALWEYAETLPKGSKLYEQAKELIKNIIRVTWGEGWSYSLDWKVKAEKFLKESDYSNDSKEK